MVRPIPACVRCHSGFVSHRSDSSQGASERCLTAAVVAVDPGGSHQLLKEYTPAVPPLLEGVISDVNL